MTVNDEQPPTGLKGLSSEDADGIRNFVGKVSDQLHELELEEDQSAKLKSHISELKGHLDSEDPEHSLVEEALAAMHRVLESSTARKTTELLAEAGRFLTGVG